MHPCRRPRLSAVCLLLLWTAGSWGDEPAASHIFAGTEESSPPAAAYPDEKPAGPLRQVALANPFGIEITEHDIYITTVDDHCIYRSDLGDQRIQRIAGCGLVGYSGDGGPADEARFNWPHEVRCDAAGNLYVADTRNHVIRIVDGQDMTVRTLAGDGTAGFAGEGASGSAVRFNQPHSVALDHAGGLLVADTLNHRLRRIDLESGRVTTICGTGKPNWPLDGAAAADSPLFGPRSLAVDADSIWIALREGNSIWRIDRHTNTLHHVAGTGKKGYGGDGGPPLQATFNGPKGLTVDAQKRLLVVDTENQAVRRIDLKAQTVSTVMGGSAADATHRLKRPHGIAFWPGLGYLVADSEHHRVLRAGGDK